MVKPALYFWEQYQQRTLVRDSRRTRRHAYSISSDRLRKESGERDPVPALDDLRVRARRHILWLLTPNDTAVVVRGVKDDPATGAELCENGSSYILRERDGDAARVARDPAPAPLFRDVRARAHELDDLPSPHANLHNIALVGELTADSNGNPLTGDLTQSVAGGFHITASDPTETPLRRPNSVPPSSVVAKHLHLSAAAELARSPTIFTTTGGARHEIPAVWPCPWLPVGAVGLFPE